MARDCFMCPIPASPLADRVAGTLAPDEAWVVIVNAARTAQVLITSGCESSRHDAEERGWRSSIERYRVGARP